MKNETTAKKKNYFDEFLDKYGLYLLFIAVVFALFFYLLKQFEIYPFGKKTIANYDYLAQIAPSFENFYYFLEGKTSLFYVKDSLGGVDMFQSLCFMALSPFTIVILLFGKGNTYNAMSFVLPLKIACIGCSALFYIKKRFPNINSLVAFSIALLYSVCGYVGTANTYINWMDFLIYMPLVAWGFKRLIDTGSVKLHAIFTACMIYTCFSISSFSLFLIFPIYILYILIVCEKTDRKKHVTNTIVSLLYAIILALPVLVPVLISSSQSSRNVSLFGQLDDSLANDLDHTFVKLTYILADTFLLIFGILAIIKSRRTKLGKFLIVGELIVLAPILIDGSCYLLNAGSYNHYAMRFGFLNGFASLYTCCLFFEHKDYSKFINCIEPEEPTKETPDAETGEEKNLTVAQTLSSFKVVRTLKANKKNKNFYISIVAVCLFTFITIYFTKLLKTIFDKADGLYTIVDTDRSDNNFSSHYAHSEGGFNVIAWVFLLALILSVLAYILVKRKTIYVKACAIILAIFALGQSGFIYSTLIEGNQAGLGNYTDFTEFTDYLKDNEEDYKYYRVADYKGYVSSNVGFAKNVKIFSAFSSNVDKRNFQTAYNLNYISQVTGCVGVDSGGKSFFGDCLLGARYVLVHDNNNGDSDKDEKKNVPKNRVYFGGNALKHFANGFNVYENKYALPTCFTFNSDTLPDLNTDDYFESMQNLYTFLGGEGNLFTEVAIDDYVSKGDNGYTVKHRIDLEGEWFLKLSFPSDYVITKNGEKLESNKISFGYTVIQDGGFYWTSTIDCSNRELSEDLIKSRVSFMIIEPVKMQTLYNNLFYKDSGVNLYDQHIIRYNETKTGVRFTVENASENQYVYLSNVVLKNSKLKINGKNAEFIENKAGLMIFKLNKGDNAVKTSYTSPYPFISLACIVISALLIVGLTLLRRKTKFLTYDATQSVLYYASVMLTAILIVFFIVYPLILFINKAFLKVNLGRIISVL